ncbi:MAG: PLP-dependent aminotransferase family protein [Rhodobacterales bacterium]|nr:PLP-dependent aminotransferase family protein [Rhodobacterales bacterium]
MTIWIPDLTDRRGPRYLAIAEALAADRADGRLAAGTRLPTHRDLAYRLGVTVGTVSRAYAEAERRGLIRGEVGRGTFVQGAEPEQDFRPFTPAAAPPTAGPDDLVMDLRSNVPAGAFGVDLLSRALSDIAAAPDLVDLMRYQSDTGHPRHRAAGARLFATQVPRAETANVLVTNGAQHGLAATLTGMGRAGDTLLTENLTFPGMTTLAAQLDRKVRGVAMDAEGLRPDALDEACRTSDARVLYTIPYAQNPTTAVMGPQRRRDIVAVARRHGLTIIEDGIFGLTGGDLATPMAAEAPDITCYILSLSKCVAPGLRAGFVLAPPDMVDRVARGVRATAWMASPLSLEVAARWIEDGTIDSFIDWNRREADDRVAMARHHFDGPVLRSAPGCYHVWLALPDTWTPADLVREAAHRNVLLVGPDVFQANRGPVPPFVRLSLGGISRPALERSLAHLAELLAAPPHPDAALL